jgi:hypothetical protein
LGNVQCADHSASAPRFCSVGRANP